MHNIREILGLLVPGRSAEAKHSQLCTHRESCKLTTPICTLLAAGMVLLILIVDIGSAKTFTSADLEGTWNVHGLGVKENSGAWGYGTFIFEDTGKFTGTYITSTGHTESPKGTLSINNEGVISALPDFGITASSLHGVMSNKKDVIVCTHTGGDNSYKLMIFTKSAGTFATSDLQGTWVYHGLISGNEPDQVPGWYWYSMTVDKAGNALFSVCHDSQGNQHHVVHPVKFSVGKGGIVTLSGEELPFFHGAMNQSKDMIVLVATMAPGEDDDVRGYNLLVAVKQAPGGYATGDLAGTWYWHALATGYDTAWKGWFYGTTVVDGIGNFHFVPGSYLNSSGWTGPTWSATWSITSDGIVTISNAPTFHGIMNLSKDMMVGTMDDGGGGYDLIISVGRPALDEFDFDMDGDVDFVDFANFANHWLK